MLKLVISLILIGFAIKLAVIPFAFWLAPMAEKSTAMTAVLVISLLDMAELVNWLCCVWKLPGYSILSSGFGSLWRCQYVWRRPAGTGTDEYPPHAGIFHY
jgi:hypothetical protein